MFNNFLINWIIIFIYELYFLNTIILIIIKNLVNYLPFIDGQFTYISFFLDHLKVCFFLIIKIIIYQLFNLANIIFYLLNYYYMYIINYASKSFILLIIKIIIFLTKKNYLIFKYFIIDNSN